MGSCCFVSIDELSPSERVPETTAARTTRMSSRPIVIRRACSIAPCSSAAISIGSGTLIQTPANGRMCSSIGTGSSAQRFKDSSLHAQRPLHFPSEPKYVQKPKGGRVGRSSERNRIRIPTREPDPDRLGQRRRLLCQHQAPSRAVRNIRQSMRERQRSLGYRSTDAAVWC